MIRVIKSKGMSWVGNVTEGYVGLIAGFIKAGNFETT